MATPAQIKAHTKYEKKAYQNIRLRVRKDDPDLSLDKIKAAADAAGQSVNAFILEAINDKINK